jgi:hypothetical protein
MGFTRPINIPGVQEPANWQQPIMYTGTGIHGLFFHFEVDRMRPFLIIWH